MIGPEKLNDVPRIRPIKDRKGRVKADGLPVPPKDPISNGMKGPARYTIAVRLQQ